MRPRSHVLLALTVLAVLLTSTAWASASALDVRTGRGVASGAGPLTACVTTVTITLGQPATSAGSNCPGPPPLGTNVLCSVTDGSADTCTARLVVDSTWGRIGDRAASVRVVVTTATGRIRPVEVTFDPTAHLNWTPEGLTTWQGWGVTGCGTSRWTARFGWHITDRGFQVHENMPWLAWNACQ